MSVPGIVESALDGEEIAARVSLGGEDELYVTPTRTLIYRGEGLLRDESIEEYGHDAERLTISEGRRKTRFSLEYPLDGTQEFTLPAKHADEAVHPILAGMLNASGVTDSGEAVLHTYRFSELTLVITSSRIVKHIGEAVWDDEHEEYPFSELTGITFEDGEHATQIVLEIDGRPERIKTPSDEAPRVREHLEQALFEFYDVESMSELEARIEPDEAGDDGQDEAPGVDFGEGVDPLEADPPSGGMGSSTEQLTDDRFDGTDPDLRQPDETDDDPGQPDGTRSTPPESEADPSSQQGESGNAPRSAPETTDPAGASESTDPAAPGREESTAKGGDQVDRTGTERSTAESAEDPDTASEPATPDDVDGAVVDPQEELEAAGFKPAENQGPDVGEELAELREAVEKQNRLLARQQRTIEQLIEELRRGR